MHRSKAYSAGIVLAIGLCASGTAVARDVSALEQTGNAFTEIARTALPAVVFIDVEATVEVAAPQYRYRDPSGDFFRRQFPYNAPMDPQPRRYHQQGQGSGFIISKDGYILTNHHVVSDADRIRVTLGDGREFEARLVGADPKTEVALIKIEDEDELPYLELGDSDALEVGEWVLAAGNPFGLSQTITSGIVSAKERSEVGITEYANFIQTDAAINPGNSGGPLLNIHGEVVGINTAIFSQTGGYMGIGFAIPINQAAAIKDQLIDHGSVRRSVLGIYIQEVDDELAESFGLEERGGILIAQVMDGSAAEEAGLVSGDIVVELNGDSVGKVGSFRSRVASILPNTAVNLKIFREGKYRDVTAVTQAMDGEDLAVGEDAPSTMLEQLGLQVQDIDEETALSFNMPDYGVMISDVQQDSTAWRAGLRHGHFILTVNQHPVRGADEFAALLRDAEAAGRILLLVSDGRGMRYVVLTLEP